MRSASELPANASSAAAEPIPQPKGLPWLGNLLQLPRDRVAQTFLEISRQFPQGLYQLDFVGRCVPFVYSADLVAELCDETRFRKLIGPPLSFLRAGAGDGLFTAHQNEPNWGKAHRILLPAFSQRAMKGYFDVMLEVANALADKWTRQGPDADISVADDMTRLTLDTISLAGFGYRFDSFKTPALHPFLEAMAGVLSEAMGKLTRLPFKDRFMHEHHRRFERDVAAMHQLVDEVIRKRRHAQDGGTGASDLLGLMLNARDPVTDLPLDDTNIRFQVITFLIAGHETTSGLLTFALYMLLRHPAVLAQGYAEVDRVLPGDTVPQYAHLAQLDVIERVLKETLRLWPTAPSFGVAPYEDTRIGGRYAIRKDQRVVTLLMALHRDPAVWDRPEVFDIDRFLPENEARIHPHAYKPFGNGERACIGRQFALTEAKLALAVILQRFALSDPHDYAFHIKETLTLKPDGFRLRARLRNARERLLVSVPSQANAAADADTQTTLAGGGEPMHVLYGGSLGTCQDIAEQIAATASRAGFDAKVAALDAIADALPQQGTLVVVAATYNGRAPDSARTLEGRLDSADALVRQAPGLRYAVLGCGNSQWPAFQAFPKRVDAMLAAAGAQAIVPRGEADGNGGFDTAVDAWTRSLWAALGARQVQADVAAVSVQYLAPDAVRATVLPAAARSMTVLANEELVRDPTGLWDFTREAPRGPTRHLTVRLPEGVTYATGDHLAVYPRNADDRVEAAIARLGLEGEALVTLTAQHAHVRHLPLNQPVTVRQLLRDFVELQDTATARDITALHATTRCPFTRSQLAVWIDGEAAAQRFDQDIQAAHLSVLDLLIRFPAIDLTLEGFLARLGAMRPRFYSIASSARVSPDVAALTVGTVSGPAWSGVGTYRGTASNYLMQLQAGAEIAATVRTPNPLFAPDVDACKPMVLICAGTGIAPFRGFLEERAAQQAAGEAVATSLLCFGCRHPEHDFLYRDALRAWEDAGVVQVLPAYSCVDSHPHRFVQHALWDAREAVWAAFDAGATLYVCGDGRAMAPAVRDTLIRLHQARYGSDLATASDWLTEQMQSGRYRQDVFN
ncbi:cytochrome P450 [Ralstonia insidiosa]|jgi:cytochrome P450/NADPH-cytochrome P450 reductase|uniref:bifunctional cytochrome P450/NADPH--P450 reductase n=1 Tax=Ralstonia TaxID=48736 RepID=UPI000664A88D|nr:cytochrome P450 [Ralstonia insidiosa]KMW44383.1 P450 reductase [Ralstonia sp. MD27]MBX3771571.1 cytochrome P450 [Ralstonia pickettii]NOZ99036.1 cytochrome P450 [Betaproteobacteria bacterium]MBA9858547.1 cytochrome P450 [Ralstonia insidiosa]MBA9871796.1 cytochrome P450 [Ralstonia insidiosa]